MKLEGLHHITMITADARKNVAFHAGTLGLRLVKKTVNFDAPEAYHLDFGDEQGSPGSILTWFEFDGVGPGRPGAGMIHTIQLGVDSEASLDFWAARLGERGVDATRAEDRLAFADEDGLRVELVVARAGNPPLRAEHPEVPAAHAILGLEGARAYTAAPIEEDRILTEVLGFTPEGEGAYRVQGEQRHFHWAYDAAPPEPGRQGAGSVHHIAWASQDADHERWQQRVRDAGGRVTPVIDRDYFNAIYFQEPRGILFEIATLSPGFASDEVAAYLGEELRLPTQHEHLREHLERTLTPLVNPRVAVTTDPPGPRKVTRS